MSTYVKGPFDVCLGGQERLADELVVVALLERLRSIRNIAIVAKDREPGAHLKRGMLLHVLWKDHTVIIISILRRHACQFQRIVSHDLHSITNCSLSIRQNG